MTASSGSTPLCTCHRPDSVGARPSAGQDERHLQVLSTRIAETLINAMEAKNAFLRGHSQRVAELAASMAEAMGLAPDVVEHVRLAGRLHDIGLIGIREAVLDKPGPLEPAEYAHVQDHVRIGLEILAPMTHLGPVLEHIADHHERPDGSGYPRRIVGNAISLGGRILAAADTFDAMTSRRAYRDSRTEQETLAYMSGLVGTSLFPDAFDSLRRVVEQRQSLVFLGDMRAPGAHVESWHASSDPHGVDAAADRTDGITDVISDLPNAERMALTLHYLENLSDADIARVLGRAPDSVLVLRENAMRRLRDVSPRGR